MREFLMGVLAGAGIMWALGLIDKTAAQSLEDRISSKFQGW